MNPGRKRIYFFECSRFRGRVGQLDLLTIEPLSRGVKLSAYIPQDHASRANRVSAAGDLVMESSKVYVGIGHLEPPCDFKGQRGLAKAAQTGNHRPRAGLGPGKKSRHQALTIEKLTGRYQPSAYLKGIAA